MRRQARIVVGFLDQILRPRPLPVEPYHHVDREAEVGNEHSIAVLRRVEQLVLTCPDRGGPLSEGMLAEDEGGQRTNRGGLADF